MDELVVVDEYYSVVWYKEQYGFKSENDAIKCAEKLTKGNSDCYSAIIIAWRKCERDSCVSNYYEVRIFTWISGNNFTNLLVDFL